MRKLIRNSLFLITQSPFYQISKLHNYLVSQSTISLSLILLFVLLISSVTPLLAQEKSGIWIDPNKRRSLIMNANNIETIGGNWGNVGQGQNPISGIWPKGSGHDHIFEFTGFVAAQVPDSAGNLIIIISDGYIDGGGTSGEFDPATKVEYKYHPLPGYLNEVEGQD